MTDTRTDWRQPREMAEAVDLFPPGTKVRHLNPKLAGWTGVVATAGGGVHIEGPNQHPNVWVRWEVPADTPGQVERVVGWYSSAAIEPVPDDEA